MRSGIVKPVYRNPAGTLAMAHDQTRAIRINEFFPRRKMAMAKV
jgi:hypothetical protein